MKQCAIVKNGKDVVKVSNLKRKFNKIQSNPLMEILEECDLEELETKYNYYKNLYKEEDTEPEPEPEISLYYYKYTDSPYWLVSIYSDEDKTKPVEKRSKEEYNKMINGL